MPPRPPSSSFLLCPITSLPKPTFPYPFLLAHRSQAHHPPTSSSLRAYATSTSKNPNKPTRKRKARTTYLAPPLTQVPRFSLLSAIRYIHAFEVGRHHSPSSPPSSPSSSFSTKYELAIRLRSQKNGPTIRNRIHLPHPIPTTTRIAILLPTTDPSSKLYQEALSAGGGNLILASEPLLQSLSQPGGDSAINFDTLLCHTDALPLLSRYTSSLGKILGPRGLMPSPKRPGTIIKDIGAAVKQMVGAMEYREKIGVVRGVVGEVGLHGPEEMMRNVREFVGSVRKDCGVVGERDGSGRAKEVHEVVLSSTNSPGFSLSGDISSPDSVPAQQLVA